MSVKWSISNLNRQISLDGKSDVVTAVHWQVTDSETGDDAVKHNGQAFGASSLNTSDLSSFTAYADITEADAIAWAKTAIGADQVAAYEKSVADQLTESKTPTTGTGRPWND